SREPSQVRKEAALSGPSRVPQGCLVRANDEYGLVAPVSTAGARSYSIRSFAAAQGTCAAVAHSLASDSARSARSSPRPRRALARAAVRKTAVLDSRVVSVGVAGLLVIGGTVTGASAGWANRVVR